MYVENVKAAKMVGNRFSYQQVIKVGNNNIFSGGSSSTWFIMHRVHGVLIPMFASDKVK